MSNLFINSQFSDYLDRYCTGIVKLKKEIKKISVFFNITDSYSYHSCKFSIDIKFHDYKALSATDKEDVDDFFFNGSNSSGNQFVSFIYQPQKRDYIDGEVLKSFIYHYEFAQALFKGFIQNIIPKECILEVAPLESDPFLIYTISFLSRTKYSDKHKRSFEDEYLENVHRSFDFDHNNHDKLVKAAVIALEDHSRSITDKEIYQAQAGNPESIRRFVLKQNVPFSYRNSSVIDEINIDNDIFRKKLTTYTSGEFDKDIDPGKIIRLLDARTKEINDAETSIKQRIEALGIQEGDYIYVENGSPEKHVGKVIEIRVVYSRIEIRYQVLKKDLSEKRPSYKLLADKDFSYSISNKVLNEEGDEKLKKGDNYTARFFKSKGIKNPFFQAIKKLPKSV